MREIYRFHNETIATIRSVFQKAALDGSDMSNWLLNTRFSEDIEQPESLVVTDLSGGMSLDSAAVGHIPSVFVLVLATGTDLVYHLQQIRLERNQDSDVLSPTPEYLAYFNELVMKMTVMASKANNEQERTLN